MDDAENYAVVANVISDRIFRNGSAVWLSSGNGEAERVMCYGPNKSGYFVFKYIAYKKLCNFRPRWIPEHLRPKLVDTCSQRDEAQEWADAFNKFYALNDHIPDIGKKELDMKQWVMTKFIATEDPEFGILYKLAIYDYLGGANMKAWYRDVLNPDGTPKVGPMLALIDVPDVAAFDSLTDCEKMPDIALDSNVITIAPAVKTEFQNNVGTFFGATVKSQVISMFSGNGRAWREIVNYLGKLYDPDFDVDTTETQAQV